MRPLFVLGSATIAAFVACTVSEENLPSNLEPDAAAPEDASGGRDVVVGSDAAEEERDASCSDEGWCKTNLPSQGLIVRDIWPFADRAFAVAESHSLGIRVMEWTVATSKWEVIDDNAPNDIAVEYATKIWAPNPNEIYVALAPFAIYHGQRGAEAWSWRIETAAIVPALPVGDDIARHQTLGVWGAGSEVYAWYLNSLYRRNPSGEWVTEYVADDTDAPGELMLFMGAAGVGADDIWFSGIRYSGGYSCTFLVRKTDGDYRRIADAIRSADFRAPCLARPGSSLLESKYFPIELQSRDGKRFFFANSHSSSVYRIEEGDGGITTSLVDVPRQLIFEPRWTTLWAESNDRVWLGGGPSGGSGWGALIRGDGLWDGGKFEYSSTAPGGVPLHRMPNQIRGTSAANIWVVGEGYALHKTTL